MQTGGIAAVRPVRSILFKCLMIIGAFTLIILVITGAVTYYLQMTNFQEQSKRRIRNVGAYLSFLMVNEGNNFRDYQTYYMDHYEELDIPYDFDSYQDAYANFHRLFAKNYPDKALTVDINYNDLSDEVKHAWFTYYHEYWVLTFEKAREAFNLPYTYYLVMKDDVHDVVYMIDGERTRRKDNGNLLYLGDTYHNDHDKYAIMWRTWETGEEQDDCLEFDNSWGHTYCYYTPLIINGEKMGVIGSEVLVADVNRDILNQSLLLMYRIGCIMAGGMGLLLAILYVGFIKRTRRLEQFVALYSENKDESVAEDIEREYKAGDEISSLGGQIAHMIHEMENHIRNLSRTTQALASSRQHAAELDVLSNRDPVTGIRNKSAYEREVQLIEKSIRNKEAVFGVAWVDLNYMKQINNTYGYVKGDEALRKLCRVVCRIFAHSAVFRMDNDSFAVILLNEDYRLAESLTSEFMRALGEISKNDALEGWERITAAIGYAAYDPETDENFESVERRAETAMFERKRQMKALHIV
ncbi:MAG: GGDEF domain-containing protein [Lachnospiraceae bacterium]|nr:GGDEF domain-containing protein [Lachnospiraceae bacterium]